MPVGIRVESGGLCGMGKGKKGRDVGGSAQGNNQVVMQ